MSFDTLAGMLALLGQWTARGWLRELDRALAVFLAEQAPDAHPLVILGAALASHQLGRGHVCLDLEATLEDSSFALSLPPDGHQAEAGGSGEPPPVLPAAVLAGVDATRWQAACNASTLVAGGPGGTPLVLAGTRLYLRRYWQYERDVHGAIGARLKAGLARRDALPAAALRQALDTLFPEAPSATAQADWQKMACALAAGNVFSIVTGGPGTGKTTTVVKLLALLQSLHLHGRADADDSVRALRIRLAAPTGKAAARLNESIAGAVRGLRLDGLPHGELVRARIPTEVTTLHRLLGSRPDSRRFRHHVGNPLPLDVLVVDEASMVDLEMMAALLAALPDSARLVLLGDKDQLASVEAGAVLGELCRRAGEGHYLPSTRDWLEAVSGEKVAPQWVDAHGTPLDQAVAMLRHSHRFTADSGIGRLADAVNSGDVPALREIWRLPYPDLSRLSLASPGDAPLRALAIDGAVHQFVNNGRGRYLGGEALPPPVGLRHYLETLHRLQPEANAKQEVFDAWARAVLEAHGRFQVLCALRRGPWGVEGLNQRIAALLVDAGLLTASQGWYLGRPVLVTRNDYGLGLMNGDIGITLALPQVGLDGVPRLALRVAFAAGDGAGTIRWVLPSRLQSVESVYAMTVHKSQGSEFTHAALVLPEHLNPVLTRELVYTGITRARHWFSLASADPTHRVMEDATRRRVRRASGLLDDTLGRDMVGG
ncbi:exodeoxyribonuclease V subunit alpha [Variovorax ginsengisoli]|uniref:RecBCD enzyme subunit RecD n=1 Tax=Variovorax ginsengisoli TaxID=363844 RepID=A0ABT9SE00_9BURK|nr:exodeoxyribonuclease V subunit alpha [Variovorax ginsengisoli]MDP9902595.1 exodeoxyribonuclease V alpha subunit [Variovorax ginsengisoli]